MPDQSLDASIRICCVLNQNGYHKVGDNRQYTVMRKDNTNGKPEIQTSTILVPKKDVMPPDIIDIISHRSGIPLDQFK